MVNLPDLPPNFMAKIKTILATPIAKPTATPFRFEATHEAAIHNAAILQKHDFDMAKVIAAHPNSHLSYGSEFRAAQTLEPLLEKSPFWNEVEKSLTKGARYPLERISNKRRLADLKDAIKRGNHKSAKANLPILQDKIEKEAKAGFQLPTTIDSTHLIPPSPTATHMTNPSGSVRGGL